MSGRRIRTGLNKAKADIYKAYLIQSQYTTAASKHRPVLGISSLLTVPTVSVSDQNLSTSSTYFTITSLNTFDKNSVVVNTQQSNSDEDSSTRRLVLMQTKRPRQQLREQLTQQLKHPNIASIAAYIPSEAIASYSISQYPLVYYEMGSYIGQRSAWAQSIGQGILHYYTGSCIIPTRM